MLLDWTLRELRESLFGDPFASLEGPGSPEPPMMTVDDVRLDDLPPDTPPEDPPDDPPADPPDEAPPDAKPPEDAPPDDEPPDDARPPLEGLAFFGLFGESSAARADDVRPTEFRPVETKSVEIRPADTKPVEITPAATKPGPADRTIRLQTPANFRPVVLFMSDAPVLFRSALSGRFPNDFVRLVASGRTHS